MHCRFPSVMRLTPRPRARLIPLLPDRAGFFGACPLHLNTGARVSNPLAGRRTWLGGKAALHQASKPSHIVTQLDRQAPGTRYPIARPGCCGEPCQSFLLHLEPYAAGAAFHLKDRFVQGNHHGLAFFRNRICTTTIMDMPSVSAPGRVPWGCNWAHEQRSIAHPTAMLPQRLTPTNC